MPKEYFELWFTTLLICNPDYKKYFPEVYNALFLYREIAKYFNIQSDQYFFDVTNGKNLIKTDIISKDKLECLSKLFHFKETDSKPIYVYDKNKDFNSIWYDGEYLHEFHNVVFLQNKNDGKIDIKRINDITEEDFNNYNISNPTKSYLEKKGHFYSVIQVNKIKSVEDLENVKKRNSLSKLKDNKEMEKIKKDLGIGEMNRFIPEIREFLKDTYLFISNRKINFIDEGWVNIFPGINLVSEEIGNGHIHVHSYGKHENVNLFNLIGKKFKCSCYYVSKGKEDYYCNQYFTFNKRVKFNDCIYYIDGNKKVCSEWDVVIYDLQREKVRLFNNNTKGFYINY